MRHTDDNTFEEVNEIRPRQSSSERSCVSYYEQRDSRSAVPRIPSTCSHRTLRSQHSRQTDSPTEDLESSRQNELSDV